MLTLTCCIAFLGFYLLYSTSKRAELTLQYKLQRKSAANKKTASYFGIGLLLISLIPCLFYYGIGAGIFSYLVIVMTVGCCIVLIAPLRFFNLTKLIIITVIAFVIEIFLK
ncbi:hypothetical protein CW731_04510 [Polaribacter sp. ALD11]|uniref:hypothetical protein n=1 Tax=Polaribacter sp. ALD11 TaxID=2058137 RepID=UPI000C307369|nr:hypothetical protein [Polaribacter sp. ALD11]AUC84608.1 hypothetical protein CW731_04510 [Polaribacter sp. ALD11]